MTCGSSMDIYKTGYSQLTRCFKHIEMEQKKFFKFFMLIMVLTFAALGGSHFWNWDFTAFQGSFQAVACMIIIAFLGKVVDILTKMLSFMKFTSMDTARVRQSLTTGNVVQLNMRAVGKLEYLERRSMKLFARSSDFWRDLKEDIVMKVWNSHNAGYKALEDQIIQYIHRKNMHGVKIDQALSVQFMAELTTFFHDEKWGHIQGSSQYDFLDYCPTVQIQQIWIDNQYFIQDGPNRPGVAMEFNTNHFAWHV